MKYYMGPVVYYKYIKIQYEYSIIHKIVCLKCYSSSIESKPHRVGTGYMRTYMYKFVHTRWYINRVMHDGQA